MGKTIEIEDKTCWACKRILIGKGKVGLCSDCLNKYGTPAAAAGAICIGFAVKQVVKNSGKIIKFVAKNGGKAVKLAANVVKNIRL